MASVGPAQVPAACRRGKNMVVPRGAALPANCVKCGATARRPWRKKFYWHPPAYYLIILINLLIYAVVAIIVRKSIELNIPLCEAHHGDRKRYNILAAILLLGTIPAGLAVGNFSSLDPGVGWLVAVIMFIAGLVFWSIASGYVRPRKIDETHGEFVGVGEPFLRLLPPEPPGLLQ